MDRKEVLEAAMQCVCKDREEQYGDPVYNFSIVAAFWGMYLFAAHPELAIDTPDFVTICDVGMMMALLKIARIATGSSPDSYVDLAGYAALAGEIFDKWAGGQTDGN